MSLDETDRKILSLLKTNSQMQYGEIGKRVNLSAPAVHARVKKMEANKTILRYTVDLSPEALGSSLCAFVRMTNHSTASGELAKEFKKFPQIEECHAVAGEDCLMVKLRVKSTAELSQLLEKIREIKAVERTLTVVVLETYFERGLQP